MNKKVKESKPINWHRPLQPGEYTQRYLRNRWADVSEDHLKSPDEYEEYDWDDGYYWNIYGPASPEDYAIHNAWQHLTGVGGNDEIRIAFENIGWTQPENKKPDKVSKRERFKGRTFPRNVKHIEKHLAKHIAGLAEGSFDPADLPLTQNKDELQIIFDLISEENDRLQSQDTPAVQNYYLNYIDPRRDSPYLVCLLFSPFWVRSPTTWIRPQEPDIFPDFVKHLFEVYPTRNFLLAEWSMPFDGVRYKWLIFYLILAQGGSLKKAGSLFNWSIGKQFTRHFNRAPEGLSPVLASIYAQIRCLGGSTVEFNRLSRNAAYIQDPTEVSENLDFKAFWEGSVKWLTRYREHLADDEVDLILEWAMHQHTEYWYNQVQFSWRGRTPERALAASQRYNETRDEPWIDYKWNAHGWDWEYTDDYDVRWTFVELTTGLDLHEESKKLHHCVESYAPRCATHHSAILSVACNNEKLLTIEISPEDKEIVQVKGMQNRFPTSLETQIIDAWYYTVISQNENE